MKILKYKKIKNKYRIFLDDNSYLDLYENTILNYNLLLKKEITNIEISNLKEEILDVAIKYISIKMRSKKEIISYLTKKQYSKEDINFVLNKLVSLGLINDENYVKAYVSDKFYLSIDGPYKIKKDLISFDIDEATIDKYLDNISKEDIVNKLDKSITKKINLTKNYSGNVLKNKLINYYYNLGYSKELIEEALSNKNLNNIDQGIREYNKLISKYKNKYNDYELENVIRQKLYQKGYSYDEIKKSIS